MVNPTPPRTHYSEAPSAANQDAILRLSQQVEALQQNQQEVQRLRGRLRGLTTALIALAIIGGGALIGTILGFRSQQLALQEQQEQLAAQVEELEGDRLTAEQVSQIQEQLAALNQRTQALGDQARALAEQLPALTAGQTDELRQRIQELEQGIRENVSGEAGNRLDQLTGLFRRVLGQEPAEPPVPETSESPEAAPTN